MDESEFNKLFERSVPHILERIFLPLDNFSFSRCRDVCKAWNELQSSGSYRKRRAKILMSKLRLKQKMRTLR